MDFMAEFSAWVMAYLQYIILMMTALIFLALVIFININIKLSRLTLRYQKMMRGAEGTNIEQMLLEHITEVRQTVTKVDQLGRECQRLDGVGRGCVQRVGVVRFNAFEDTGSDLSFAVALLDARNNGVVVSGIFGRNESRSYAKPVVGGQSSYFLTAEEKAAIQQAQENSPKV
jgi:hypothetical protein